MNRISKIASTIVSPFRSETAAEQVAGFALTMYYLPLLYDWIFKKSLSEEILRIAIALEMLTMALMAFSFSFGSGKKAYRDNTGSKAMCQMLAVMSFLIACIMGKTIA